MSEAVKSEAVALIMDGPIADWIVTDPVEGAPGEWQCEVRRKYPKGDGGDRVAIIFGSSKEACEHRADLFCGDGFAADLMVNVYNGIADVFNRKRRLWRPPANLVQESADPSAITHPTHPAK